MNNNKKWTKGQWLVLLRLIITSTWNANNTQCMNNIPDRNPNWNSCFGNPCNGTARTFDTWCPIPWPRLCKSSSMIYYWWSYPRRTPDGCTSRSHDHLAHHAIQCIHVPRRLHSVLISSLHSHRPCLGWHRLRYNWIELDTKIRIQRISNLMAY